LRDGPNLISAADFFGEQKMAQNYRLTDEITLDLDRILTIAATSNGIRLTYHNGDQQVIAPLPEEERRRFFDQWLAG